MDIERQGVARRKLIRRVILSIVGIAALAGVTWGLSRLKPAAPEVERSLVWVDKVRRGPMIRQVHGTGTLAAEEVVQIPAQFDGRVERRLVLPGVNVKPDTVLLVLTNPDMELAVTDYEWQVKQAKAAYEDLKVKLESQHLDQETLVAQQQSAFTQAKLQLDRDRELLKLDLKPELEVKLSEAKYREVEGRLANERKRLAILGDSLKAQLESQNVQIAKLQAAHDLKQQQYRQMTIRAGTEGVLKEVNVEAGQRVVPGTVLAKVVQPWRLKAELKIPETQVKDIAIGQPAEIDTRNGVIKGSVVRIDPAATSGTVTVDVKLAGELPPGARPDLGVDGTIELERLADVVYVGRPVSGQPNTEITLFKLEADGRYAERVRVKLGRTSVNTVEVVGGLQVGDQVILSDMTNMDDKNRIRVN